MSTETTATVAEVKETDPVADALAAQKAAIIDAAVRMARAESWCGTFEQVMGKVFPDEKNWYDSDGFTCRGYDRDGYGHDGYDANGYDRDGFSEYGTDREGYNRDGVNQYGFNRDGIHVATGKTREEFTATYRYDRSGYDINGWDRDGYNRDGHSRDQLLTSGRFVYDVDGYNVDGLDPHGYRRPGQAS